MDRRPLNQIESNLYRGRFFDIRKYQIIQGINIILYHDAPGDLYPQHCYCKQASIVILHLAQGSAVSWRISSEKQYKIH